MAKLREIKGEIKMGKVHKKTQKPNQLTEARHPGGIDPDYEYICYSMKTGLPIATSSKGWDDLAKQCAQLRDKGHGDEITYTTASSIIRDWVKAPGKHFDRVYIGGDDESDEVQIGPKDTEASLAAKEEPEIISQVEVEEACNKEKNESITNEAVSNEIVGSENAGFEIIAACTFKTKNDTVTYVIGHDEDATLSPYVTWFTLDGNSYNWGHYFKTESEAIKDWGSRIKSELNYYEE